VLPVYWRYILAEDRMMAEEFGSAYAEYGRSVGRLLPRLRRPTAS